ncbi:uncharacterized protein BDZ99DRAFT_202526 [Mytilinidion resinicola]|uniref:Uncharacterized protein n=1 Tax=Mytilinidion resinicola TaxID=574789 RepID=A0A6A6Y0R3_9PEZI|nr:uncharacterized protein BDZ99DRAFT_202526 [Mytilinidion resinicola]KAF2802406.1 hypothetical protein BDZ99DRAFT_202526 [Mytilinidion resinicola]
MLPHSSNPDSRITVSDRYQKAQKGPLTMCLQNRLTTKKDSGEMEPRSRSSHHNSTTKAPPSHSSRKEKIDTYPEGFKSGSKSLSTIQGLVFVASTIQRNEHMRHRPPRITLLGDASGPSLPSTLRLCRYTKYKQYAHHSHLDCHGQVISFTLPNGLYSTFSLDAI